MKKKIITVLLTIFVSIPCFLIMPKAATGNSTSQYTSTTYGDYWVNTGYSTTEFDYEIGPIGVKFPVNSGSWLEFHYNFKQEYNGYVTFTLKSNLNVSLNTCIFSVDGGVLTQSPDMTNNTNTRDIQISFNNSTGFIFRIMKQESAQLISNMTFATNSSITIKNFNFNDEPDLSNVMTVIKDIDFYVPGMSTSLSNIDTDLDNINTNIQALSPYIDQLEGYVDGLEGLLADLQKVSLYNIEPYQHSAWFWCSKFDSSFPRWKYGLPYMQYNLNWNNGEYTSSKSFRLSAGYSYIMVFYTNNAISSSDITLYYSATTGNVSITSLPINEISAQLYLQAFIFTNNNNGFSSFEPEINKTFEMYPLYFGLTNNIPDDINMLLGREYDNTYTRLLQSINNGIGVLNGDYDTTQYDNYEQTIDGLNDSLRNTFDNYDNNFNRSLNEIFSHESQGGVFIPGYFTSTFGHISNCMNSLLNDIFVAAPTLKYIFLYGLFLLVIGVLF